MCEMLALPMVGHVIDVVGLAMEIEEDEVADFHVFSFEACADRSTSRRPFSERRDVVFVEFDLRRL